MTRMWCQVYMICFAESEPSYASVGINFQVNNVAYVLRAFTILHGTNLHQTCFARATKGFSTNVLWVNQQTAHARTEIESKPLDPDFVTIVRAKSLLQLGATAWGNMVNPGSSAFSISIPNRRVMWPAVKDVSRLLLPLLFQPHQPLIHLPSISDMLTTQENTPKDAHINRWLCLLELHQKLYFVLVLIKQCYPHRYLETSIILAHEQRRVWTWWYCWWRYAQR